MVDDDRLLELLGRALAPPPVEPPPERVAAFRALLERGRVPEAEADATGEADDVGFAPPGDVGAPVYSVDVRPSSPPAAARPPSSSADVVSLPPRVSRVPEPVGRVPRRVGWIAAGATVAAAAVVVALLAVPDLMTRRSNPEASVSTARAAVARLRTALATGDPIAVAEADADLLRVAGRLPSDDRDKVHTDAVAAHVDAIEFMRENPRAGSPVGRSGSEVAAPGSASGPGPQRGAPTTVAGEAAGPSRPTATTMPPVPTTAAPVARSVTIVVVSPELDGSFEVVFGTAGFTPEPGRRPGTYAVQFSFDDGQSPVIWTSASPWRFPGELAVTYRRVCARVVDASGVEDPNSGGCRNIL